MGEAAALAPSLVWATTASRAVVLLALLQAAGASLFALAVGSASLRALDPADRARAFRAFRLVVLAACAAGLLGLAASVLSETAALAGTVSSPMLAAVLGRTLFGHVVLAQAVLLAAGAALLAGDGAPPFARATPPLALAVLAEAAHGHGMAMGGPFGVVFLLTALHLLAAAAWLGALLPLALLVRRWPRPAGLAASRLFSRWGKGAVLVLAASAVVQGAILLGGVRALFAAAYGRLILVKTALFLVLLALALLNRHRLAPALRRADDGRAAPRLVRSISVQIGAFVLAVGAAALLGGLAPPSGMGGR